MPICSYLVIPEEGAADRLSRELGRIPGCDVVPAENHDLMILLTEAEGPEANRALRSRVEAVRGIQALVLTFGEIDPDSEGAPEPRGPRSRGDAARPPWRERREEDS